MTKKSSSLMYVCLCVSECICALLYMKCTCSCVYGPQSLRAEQNLLPKALSTLKSSSFSAAFEPFSYVQVFHEACEYVRSPMCFDV